MNLYPDGHIDFPEHTLFMDCDELKPWRALACDVVAAAFRDYAHFSYVRDQVAKIKGNQPPKLRGDKITLSKLRNKADKEIVGCRQFLLDAGNPFIQLAGVTVDTVGDIIKAIDAGDIPRHLDTTPRLGTNVSYKGKRIGRSRGRNLGTVKRRRVLGSSKEEREENSKRRAARPGGSRSKLYGRPAARKSRQLDEKGK